MKIGLLTNYHLECVGGAEEAIDRLACHWHRAGHEVVVLSSPPRRHSAVRPWNPTYRHSYVPRPFSTRWGISRYVRHLAREHARRPFDVVVGSDVYWPGAVVRWFSKASGVPYVVWSYGSDLMHGSRFLNRWICRRRIVSVLRDAAAVASISGYMAERSAELAADGKNVRTILNGWPDEWAAPSPGPAIVREPYLFAIGRLIERKGFHVLLDAFARISRARPELSLVIAGDGPERSQLIAQAARLGLSPLEGLPGPGRPRSRLWFPGFVHGELKHSLVRHATLGICPSLWQEPQGIVLLEMLSRGVPVVASRVGGIPDVVLPGYNGELVAPGDPTQLAECLLQILDEPRRLETLAMSAADSVAHLRWSAVAKAYLELLERVARHEPLPRAAEAYPRVEASAVTSKLADTATAR